MFNNVINKLACKMCNCIKIMKKRSQNTGCVVIKENTMQEVHTSNAFNEPKRVEGGEAQRINHQRRE